MKIVFIMLAGICFYLPAFSQQNNEEILWVLDGVPVAKEHTAHIPGSHFEEVTKLRSTDSKLISCRAVSDVVLMVSKPDSLRRIQLKYANSSDPVSDAEIVWKDSVNLQKEKTIKADQAGWLYAPVQKSGNGYLQISAFTYKSIKISLSDLSKDTTVLLYPDLIELAPVTVMAIGRTIRCYYGCTLSTITVCALHVQQLPANAAPSSTTVFPNPASAGGVVYIQLREPNKNELSLVLHNSAGQLAGQQRVNKFSATGQINYQIPPSLMPGLYILTVYDGKKKQFSEKILLR